MTGNNRDYPLSSLFCRTSLTMGAIKKGSEGQFATAAFHLVILF
jgi:hypothetical protein